MSELAEKNLMIGAFQCFLFEYGILRTDFSILESADDIDIDVFLLYGN